MHSSSPRVACSLDSQAPGAAAFVGPTASWIVGWLVLPLALCLAPAVFAQDASEESETQQSADRQTRIERLEAQVEVLARELDRLRTATAVPEDEERRSVFGMGPSASKVYLKERGLSLGGYGEANFTHFINNDGKDTADALRFVLYTGYKFTDWLVMNAEIEIEHGSTSEINGRDGTVSIEFMILDFLLHDAVNFRIGLLLNPMGYINEMHEPTLFYGISRPEPERLIIPSTWREIGAGFFGSFWGRLHYKAYMMNSMQAKEFGTKGFRDARQKGSRARAENWSFVCKLRFDVTPTLMVAASVYTGQQGQNESNSFDDDGDPTTPNVNINLPDAWTTIYEGHFQYQDHGFTLRGLWSQAFVDDGEKLSRALGRTVGTRMFGTYIVGAYDVLPWIFPDVEMSLEPFYRWEYYDTNDNVNPSGTRDGSREQRVHVAGLQFKPHPQVVLKSDYRHVDRKSGGDIDEYRVGIGFVF